jgi:hypothetical protein
VNSYFKVQNSRLETLQLDHGDFHVKDKRQFQRNLAVVVGSIIFVFIFGIVASNLGHSRLINI